MLQGLRIDGYFSWYNGWSVATEHKLQHIQTKKIFKTLSETRKLREQYAEEDKCFSCVFMWSWASTYRYGHPIGWHMRRHSRWCGSYIIINAKSQPTQPYQGTLSDDVGNSK